MAVISVVDNGPGLPPELIEHVFERFTRGDSSRAYRNGGSSTGLGLAIAAAVIGAHHGTIKVISQPGHTCFAVTLPP